MANKIHKGFTHSFLKTLPQSSKLSYRSIICYTYQEGNYPLYNPHSHVVPGADNVSFLVAGVVTLLNLQILTENENLEIGNGDQNKVGIKKDQNDQSERMPNGKAVHRSSSGFIQEVRNVEEVLLLLPHAPVVVLGDPWLHHTVARYECCRCKEENEAFLLDVHLLLL